MIAAHDRAGVAREASFELEATHHSRDRMVWRRRVKRVETCCGRLFYRSELRWAVEERVWRLVVSARDVLPNTARSAPGRAPMSPARPPADASSGSANRTRILSSRPTSRADCSMASHRPIWMAWLYGCSVLAGEELGGEAVQELVERLRAGRADDELRQAGLEVSVEEAVQRRPVRRDQLGGISVRPAGPGDGGQPSRDAAGGDSQADAVVVGLDRPSGLSGGRLDGLSGPAALLGSKE